MTTITQLEYVVAVAEEKHFGKAAKRCFVSQPSLSLQIQKAEDELDVIIFDRHKKPIALTEDGQMIYEQAKTVLKEHRRLYHLSTSKDGPPKGEFHLGIIPTVSQYLVPIFLSKFAKCYPLVKLRISEFKTEEIIELIDKEKIDAGLLVTPLEIDSIVEKQLYFEKFFAFLSTDHPLTSVKSLSETDLDESKIWLLADGHCFRDQVLKVCSLEKDRTALKNVDFIGGSLETLKQLVKKHSGYTLIPELALTQMTATDLKKHVRPYKSPAPTREVSLVHNKSFFKNKILSALEESILDSLPGDIQLKKSSKINIVPL